MNSKKMMAVFIPAIILASFALFVQILRYEPLFPKKSETEKPSEFSIPFIPTDPIVGQKRAGKTIVAFEDFGCASCKQYDDVLNQLIAKNPNTIKIIWKGLPVTRFPYPSEPALKYGFCAHKQKKFTAFKNQAFEMSDQLSETVLKKIATDIGLDAETLESCLAGTEPDEYIARNKNLALMLNIQAVPVFFVDNKQVEGPLDAAEWEVLLGIKK